MTEAVHLQKENNFLMTWEMKRIFFPFLQKIEARVTFSNSMKLHV